MMQRVSEGCRPQTEILQGASRLHEQSDHCHLVLDTVRIPLDTLGTNTKDDHFRPVLLAE
jgi:hypothetical protein